MVSFDELLGQFSVGENLVNIKINDDFDFSCKYQTFVIKSGSMMQLCSRDDLDCSSFTPVLKLDGISNGLYLAASRDTDQAVIDQLKASFQRLVDSGQHEKTLRQRLLRIKEFSQLWPKSSVAIELEKH